MYESRDIGRVCSSDLGKENVIEMTLFGLLAAFQVILQENIFPILVTTINIFSTVLRIIFSKYFTYILGENEELNIYFIFIHMLPKFTIF